MNAETHPAPDPTYSEPAGPETQEQAGGQVEAVGSTSMMRIIGRIDLHWWEAVAYAALVGVGLAMRLWELGARAMHHDESLHALYSWNLFSGLGYEHNPMMHGPLQFEANAVLFLLFGDSDVTARLLYAVMGTALIAMPLLFRHRLGRGGAVITAALLTASPALLYFSRFARNDILMAVWAFGLVICMWRYFDEGRPRYLYISAALMALAFATKETSYLIVGTLGLWCVLLTLRNHTGGMFRPVEYIGVSPPVVAGRVFRSLWNPYRMNLLNMRSLSRPAAYLTVLATISLPQWSAFAAVLQDTPLLSWTGLALAAPEGHTRIGDPVAGANVIAFVIVLGLLGLSAYVGSRWNPAVWWRCAIIFYSVWTVLYTTFFTNLYGGIKSGIWQALGYWVVQQGEGRGGQPWYYYFVIGSIYEFLPIFVGIVGIIYFLRKRDSFGTFLVYWPMTTFLLYMIASEKMPWLLVNITLPFIVLVGKYTAEVVSTVDWSGFLRRGGYIFIPGVPVFAMLLWNLALYEPSGDTFQMILIPVVIVGVLLAMVVTGTYLARRLGGGNAIAVSLLVVVVLLGVLSFRAGVIASFRNADVPVEMIVYTQTSPDVVRLLDEFERTDTGRIISVSIDSTSGFTWPWAWYLRGVPRVQYPMYDGESFEDGMGDSVVVVHSTNQELADEQLLAAYGEGERIRHRWWFPEQVYRGLTPTKIATALLDRSSWRRAMGYWLFREGLEGRLGSEDAYLYSSAEVSLDYSFSE